MIDFSFVDRLPATIATARLTLRAPIRGDSVAMARLANNWKIHRWMSRMPLPYGREDALQFIDNMARSENDHAYSILLRDSDFIGVVSFHPMADRGVELGYWLGEPYWGEGYGTEAAEVMIKAAEDAGCKRLFSRAQSANQPSRHLLEKVGFVETGEKIDDCGQHKRVRVTFYAHGRLR